MTCWSRDSKSFKELWDNEYPHFPPETLWANMWIKIQFAKYSWWDCNRQPSWLNLKLEFAALKLRESLKEASRHERVLPSWCVTPRTSVHEIYRGHPVEQIHLMIHLPMNVAKSRWNVNPLSGPRSPHLWEATRIFTLDLSRSRTKSFFLAFVAASSLCFSLLFLWPAVDRREMGIFLGFVLSSMVSASATQGNRLTQGRGCPPVHRKALTTPGSRLLSLIGCLPPVAVVTCK